PPIAVPPPQLCYPAGWHLVAGPEGMTFPVPLYQYDPTAEPQPSQSWWVQFPRPPGPYRTIPANTGVQAGLGYWAYFTTPTTVRTTGFWYDEARVQAPVGQWVQIGNMSE